MLYVCNVDEESAQKGNELSTAVQDYVNKMNLKYSTSDLKSSSSLLPSTAAMNRHFSSASSSTLTSTTLPTSMSGRQCVWLCVSLEEEASKLSIQQQVDYLQLAGVQQTGIQQIIRYSSILLDQQVFYTVGESEARSWSIQRGSTALEASSKIHSDIANGFICAEVIKYNDYMELGSPNAVKQAGKLFVEGKDYIIQDGDIILFKHGPSKRR